MRARLLLLVAPLLTAAVVYSLLGKTHAPSPAEKKGTLEIVADVPLPGPASRFDYQSLDPTDGRLYIAHMDADQLIVFDTKKRQVVANLDGFHNVHGVIVVPELKRIYASVTGDHQVAVVDRTSLKTIARIGEIKYPDGLAYAPSVNRVFVSDEKGGADVVIDTTSNAIVKTISLGGGAGNTVYDSGSDRILVAVHDKNDLVTIDPMRAEITARTELTWLQDPHGIALDAENRVAFVAGEGNNKVLAVDLTSKAIGPSLSVGSRPDVLAYDTGTKRLYVAAESGHVYVFQQANRALEPIGDLHLPHAHTVAVDSKTHLVYFPLENVNGKPVLRIMEWVGLKR